METINNIVVNKLQLWGIRPIDDKASVICTTLEELNGYLDEMDIGTSSEEYVIKKIEMSEEEFNNLKEFDGW